MFVNESFTSFGHELAFEHVNLNLVHFYSQPQTDQGICFEDFKLVYNVLSQTFGRSIDWKRFEYLLNFESDIVAVDRVKHTLCTGL